MKADVIRNITTSRKRDSKLRFKQLRRELKGLAKAKI